MKKQLFSSNRHRVPNKAIHATKNLEKNRRTCTAIKQSRVSIQLSVRLPGASSASQSDSSLVSLSYPSSVRILFDF